MNVPKVLNQSHNLGNIVAIPVIFVKWSLFIRWET